MIELQKRYSQYERRLPVTVVDLLLDPDKNVHDFLLSKYSKTTYEHIMDMSSDKEKYWLVFENDNPMNYDLYNSFDDITDDYCNYSMFDKSDRSTFAYWFAHWCAFQLTALNLKIWKFKYLFHDFEKPWLKLIWDYKKVQKWHREHNSHHLEYGLKHGFHNVDWKALMIDWECSRFSKKQCPLNCREEMERIVTTDKWKPYEKEIRMYLESILDAYFM